mgnify:CR=1 FL=1
MTVGTQLPFDRLIKSVEEWGVSEGYTDIIFQVGKGSYKPKIGQTFDFISESKMNFYFDEAQLVIGHAGMGTILNCLTKGRLLVVMPRLFKYGEHRNDHQLATFNKIKPTQGIYLSANESGLHEKINSALNNVNKIIQISEYADQGLINYISSKVL